MSAALAYEWRRLTTLRSTYWLVAIGAILVFGLAVLIALAIGSSGDISEGNDFVLGAIATQGAAIGVTPLLVAYVMGLMGVFCFGHEYRHGMIRATLTAVPSRTRVFAAKTIITGLTAFVVGGLTTLVGVVVGLAVVSELQPDSEVIRELVLGTAVYTGLFSLVGLALASIFRNQVAALIAVLLVPLVLESVIRAVLVVPPAFDEFQGLARYLPFDAGGQMFVQLAFADALDIFGYEPLDAVGGGITFAVFTAALLAAACALFVVRDA
jgi:hypothetical protein